MAKNTEVALRRYCERIETLQDEQKGISDDIRNVKAEAKAEGFCLKTLAEMLKLRALDPDVRGVREDLRDLYKTSLGLDSGYANER